MCLHEILQNTVVLSRRMILLPFIRGEISWVNGFVLVKPVLFDVFHYGARQQVTDRQAPPEEQANLLIGPITIDLCKIR